MKVGANLVFECIEKGCTSRISCQVVSDLPLAKWEMTEKGALCRVHVAAKALAEKKSFSLPISDRRHPKHDEEVARIEKLWRETK